MTEKRDQAFARIDAANAQDPNNENGQPAELLYGQRMTEQQQRLYPDASEPLQIACRGQHIERWMLPRSDFPDDRRGYLSWRTEQGRRHAERVAGIMRDVGYAPDQIERARKMLTKQGIKRDDEVQALEDVAVFTFMHHYMAPFAETQTEEEMDRIVRLTARKISAAARARALEEFDMPEALATHFRDEPRAARGVTG
ncbi:DUF4202 domain-containing protein [Paracoccus sediminicola]|uniref:DUF4202 domain-containing protein n=1 Tax=Paracoccus sediminicola TaxID=3017783 RepID=UPI0022EFF11B|nr:DUF4202 domain-containing protein [Paracoccus sediminicola]WBU58292.1 DUF4202 domain-containing protein [Paracoccus sediminicola]